MTDADISPAPSMGMNDGCEVLVTEIATVGERNLLLTDVGSLLNARGPALLDAAAA